MANANPPRRSRPASSMTARAAACFMASGNNAQRTPSTTKTSAKPVPRSPIPTTAAAPLPHGVGVGLGGGGADAPAARSALGPVDGFSGPTARPLKNRKNSLFGDSTKLVAPSPSDSR